MTGLLLFLIITLASYQHGALGNVFDGNRESARSAKLSDDGYPDSEIQVKRNSYQVVRSADQSSWPENSNICFFVHEGQTESQISCRLRFTRSKFNFNPFGLRFGKRENNNVMNQRTSIPVPVSLLQYLLSLKDKQMSLCDEESVQNC